MHVWCEWGPLHIEFIYEGEHSKIVHIYIVYICKYGFFLILYLYNYSYTKTAVLTWENIKLIKDNTFGIVNPKSGHRRSWRIWKGGKTPLKSYDGSMKPPHSKIVSKRHMVHFVKYNWKCCKMFFLFKLWEKGQEGESSFKIAIRLGGGNYKIFIYLFFNLCIIYRQVEL